MRDLPTLFPFRAQYFPVSGLLDPPQNLPTYIDALRLKALHILSPQQQDLSRALANLQCRALADLQNLYREPYSLHPRPDRDTAMDRVGELLDEDAKHTLREFLNTNPQRLPYRRGRTQVVDADSFLFAENGQYKNVAAQKRDLEDFKAETADAEAELAALEQESAA